MMTSTDTAYLAQQRNYPADLWWVAARSEELGATPLSRRLLDRPVVLYRTASGRPVALEDRCMHRWAPLSQGYLEGDELVCGYHGAVFSAEGRCVRYPGQAQVPAQAAVRAYPVIEHAPFVWICLGDPVLAPEPPQAFPWLSDPAWMVASGSLPFAANYFLLQENVLDLTHFNYAHRKTFGVTDQPVPTFKREGLKVWFELLQEDCQLPQWRRRAMGLQSQRCSRWMRAQFETPAWHQVEMKIENLEAAADERQVFTNRMVHLVTPEGPDSTHYWWATGADLPGAPDDVRAQLHADVMRAFNEDKDFLEGIQRIIRQDPRHLDVREVSFPGDLGGIQARRVLQELLAAERVHTPGD